MDFHSLQGPQHPHLGPEGPQHPHLGPEVDADQQLLDLNFLQHFYRLEEQTRIHLNYPHVKVGQEPQCCVKLHVLTARHARKCFVTNMEIMSSTSICII